MKRLLAAAILTVAVVGTVAGCGGKDIGRDAALEAALNDAGVSESDTTRLQVSEDRDDGQKVYEIRFDVDNTGYEYEVAAADGSILSSDIENQDDGTQAQGNVQNGTQDDDQGTAQNNGENAQNNTSQGTGTANSANVAVTQEQAIETALSRVSGATEQDIRISLDHDDGVYKYEGDIIYNGVEYDFEIDATTGKVLDVDYDVDGWTRPETTKDIGLEEAKVIALKDAGLKANQVKFVKAGTDYDDGRKYYEVEFYKGNREYDYTIDAATGKIVEVDYDAENYSKPSSTSVISADEARKIALKHAGVSSSNVRYEKTELDYDDGRQKYEIEFRVGNMEYEYEIDATSGNVLKAEKDYDD